MEAEIQVKQLRRLAQELAQCARKLLSETSRLDALCESQKSQPVFYKKLCAQSDVLKKQASLCKDFAAVLEQVGYLYEKTEEEIILAAEADGRRYEETLRAVSLPQTAQIPVTLK
ncbi:MAG: hypothetical protein K2N87_13565 [Eubacterium sp.]|nr:hypothetical protein [Eubacterium sp.]